MKITYLLPVIMLILILIFSSGCVEEKITYTAGMSPDYYPMSKLDKYTDEFSGLDVEILNWIAKDQGIEINFVSCYISEYKTAMDKNNIDMMCAMTVRDERKDSVGFSTPYISGPFEIITKIDSKVTAEDVMSGNAVIACQYGSAQESFVKSMLGEEEYDKRVADGRCIQSLSADTAVVTVLAGNADAAIVSMIIAEDVHDKYKMVHSVGNTGNTEYTAYGISKDDTKLLEKINAGLGNLMVSPDWKVMLNKYNFK